MLGENNFLASPPQRKEGPTRPKRTVFQDLSNVPASVASWWQSKGENNTKNVKAENKCDKETHKMLSHHLRRRSQVRRVRFTCNWGTAESCHR